MSAREGPTVALRYAVRPEPESWVLPEVPVPESRFHDLILDYLKALLVAWVARTGRDLIVARNLAIRWLEESPRVGIDPDLSVVATPPERDALTSLRLWEPGHEPPLLAVEVVSPGHPYKDYAQVQDRYAACGAQELWVFDPLLVGPHSLGGPFALQIWRPAEQAVLERVFTGAGPVRSRVLDAWLLVVEGEGGNELRIFEDADCVSPWLTALESERAAKDQAIADLAALRQRLRELEGR